MKNRVANLIPAAGTPAAKGDHWTAKAKRARRARLVLSWVRVADLLDDLDAKGMAGNRDRGG